MMAHLQTAQTGNPSAFPWPRISLETIREHSKRVFNKRACHWQFLVTDGVARGKYVFVSIATGRGKTLAFLLPVTLHPDGMLVIVTPLTALGKQTEELLDASEIPAISISAETATEKNYKVRSVRTRVYVQKNHSHKSITGCGRSQVQGGHNQPRASP
jgi:Lhr-like helicase